MIIHDNRKDYYDGVARTGVDKTCRYVRKEKEIDYPCNCEAREGGYVIGFCGKLYPFAKHIINGEYLFFYDPSAYIEKIGTNNKWEIERIKKFFDQDSEDLHKIFREYHCPVWILQTWWGQLTLNPLLRYYDFAKIMDPYSAFQQIHSYLSGVLGPEPKPIPDVDDVTKAELRGFNSQSFRTDKGTKPNRKGKRNV